MFWGFFGGGGGGGFGLTGCLSVTGNVERVN